MVRTGSAVQFRSSAPEIWLLAEAEMILKNLEKRIWDLEGFQIRFVDRKSGRDIRGDEENVGN